VLVSCTHSHKALISWYRVQQLIVIHLVNKIRSFYQTLVFITVFPPFRRWTPRWPNSVHFTSSENVSRRSLLTRRMRDLRLSRRWRFKSRSSGLWQHYTASQPRRPRIQHVGCSVRNIRGCVTLRHRRPREQGATCCHCLSPCNRQEGGRLCWSVKYECRFVCRNIRKSHMNLKLVLCLSNTPGIHSLYLLSTTPWNVLH
jgi:hypothetical protein